MFAFKGEVLERLLEDPEWAKKLDEAQTSQQVQEVLVSFAEAKGLKVIPVMMPKKTLKGGDKH